ncbi:uncharacterized protein LOC141706053 isoform X2 [Apium graveolens]|uniref:uncharacterized protein LOC141706053 isoform X2 n=1 Tax=Apium graveolens TaxID=4045 RepID=UPI003D7ADB59
MLAYNSMKKLQRENNENGGTSGGDTVNQREARNAGNEDEFPLFENEDVEDKAPIRPRGKTRMDKVHTRSVDKRVVIRMNHKFQPVADDDRIRAELGSFLGTLRRCVSLTYKNWAHVPATLKKTLWDYVKSIHDSWRGCKCRTKKNHYLAYKTDQERLEHRPDDIPLEEFKVLLMYWADEEVQKKAEKNTESRKLYTDTHTAGPVSFAQIRNKLPIPSDAAVFVETHKRKVGRKYKSDTAVMNYRLEKIEKALTGEDGSSNVEDLVTDGKSHGPSWLIGRHVKSLDISAPAPTDTYIEDLITQIKRNLQVEFEAKVKEDVAAEVKKNVQEEVDSNLAWVLKKLSEANPTLQINLGYLCATISSDEDNGTPLTRDSKLA